MIYDFRLAVVIVNYRTADLVLDCLASLHDPDGMPEQTRIIVVDGASGDGSVDTIGTAIHDRGWAGDTHALALDVNRGFAFGNNRGLERIRAINGEPQYVLFLNPDTVVRPNALSELLAFMDKTPGAGIAGSLLEDPDGTPQACAFTFPSAIGEMESEAGLRVLSRLAGRWRVLAETKTEPTEVDWVSGASMLLRSATLRQTGAFDEAFFLYYEEVDLCLRAARAGWSCHHVPHSRVIHLVGRSTGVTLRHSALPRRPAYWFAARQHYFRKNHGAFSLRLANLGWLIGHLIFRAKCLLKRRWTREVPPHILSDFLRHSVGQDILGDCRLNGSRLPRAYHVLFQQLRRDGYVMARHHLCPCQGSHPLHGCAIGIDRILHRIAKRFCVPCRKEPAVGAVDKFGDAGNIGGQDRAPQRHAFHQNDWQPLGEARQDQRSS
jgi:N-acetylglucosaminyl-diphospho-decaprenol L-rhamnosyltransferase